jgi:hypothetical protein
MTHDQEPERYPLSFTQEWYSSMDGGDDRGAFSRRHLISFALRITGHVDLAVLQGALDDVVERHELLRTLVVRDADPPYQQVLPPCPVPLEVRDLPPAAADSRDMVLLKLVAETEAGTMSAREVPLLRALLGRFDDRDSALLLTMHHAVSDGWSVEVLLRDLGAFYAARTSGTPAKLAPMRQYREFAEWQRASSASTPGDGALKYWAEQLAGARETVMPNDHEHPELSSRPYSLHVFAIDADTVAGAAALTTATRGTSFMVMLSAVYVLMNQLTGHTDVLVPAVTAGRNEPQFHNTVGLFLNVLPFRTEIGDCTSFRDVVLKTRETFIDAIANELPIGVIEHTFPHYVESRDDRRTSPLLISDTQFPDSATSFPIAEGASRIGDFLADQEVSHGVPTGTTWYLAPESGGARSGGMHFNRDEFEESTAVSWSAGLTRILANAVRDPDQDWRRL